MCPATGYEVKNRIVAGQHVQPKLGAITTQLIANRTGISRRTAENLLQGKHRPQSETLIKITQYLFGRGKERFWDKTPEELIHWLILLGYSRADILQLATSNAWSVAWKDQIVGEWLKPQLTFDEIPWPDFDQMTPDRVSDGYDEETIKDIQQQLTEALLTYKEFRRPAHRAVVLHGVNGIGKARLIAQLLDRPMSTQKHGDELPGLQEYFFQGALWIDANKPDWVIQAGKDIVQKHPVGEEQYDGDIESFYRDKFTEWLTDDKSYWKLIIVESATANDVEYLLREADPRIRFVFLVPSRTNIETIVTRFVNPNEICFLEVPRLRPEEAVEWLRRNSIPVPEQEEKWAQRLASIIAAPHILTLLGQRARYQGWKEVFARLLRRPDLLGEEVRREIHRECIHEFRLLSEEQRKRLQQLGDTVGLAETFTTNLAANSWSLRPDDTRYELHELQQRGWIHKTNQDDTFRLFWDRHFFLRDRQAGHTGTANPGSSNSEHTDVKIFRGSLRHFGNRSVKNGRRLLGALTPGVLGASTVALLMGLRRGIKHRFALGADPDEPDERPWTLGRLTATESLFDWHVRKASFPHTNARQLLRAISTLMWVVWGFLGVLLLIFILTVNSATQWLTILAYFAISLAFFTLSLPLQVADEYGPETDAFSGFELQKRNSLLEKYPWHCRLLGCELYMVFILGILDLIRIL